MKPWNRIAAALCASVLAAVGMTGCGGHGGGAAGAGGTAAATFQIIWPDGGRAIPNAAAKIVISVARTATPGQPFDEVEAQRTAPQTMLAMDELPPNTPLTFTLRAFALKDNGNGKFGPAFDPVPVATATRMVESLQPDKNDRISVTMDSAVSRLSVTKTLGSMTGAGTEDDPFVLPRNTTEVSTLSVSAFNDAQAQVLLRYVNNNPAVNPQVVWKVKAGDPIRITGGTPIGGNPTGVDVEVRTLGLNPGKYTVEVEFNDPQKLVPLSVWFLLDPESKTGFKQGLASNVANPTLTDIAARVGIAGYVDDVFLLSRRGDTQEVVPAGADAGANPAAVPEDRPFVPSPATLSRIARYGDTLGFIGAETNDGPGNSDSARTKIYAFAHSSAGASTLTAYQMVDLGSGPMGLNVADQIEDIDAPQSQTTAYVLYEATSGPNILRVGKLSRDFSVLTPTNRTITYGGAPSPRLALYRDSGDPATAVFFVAADNAVRKYGGTALPSPGTLTITTGGEQMGTIVDIACSQSKVFVLANTSAGKRVHVFDGDTGQYQHSRAIVSELSTVLSIAASTGSGDIYVAGRDAQGQSKFVTALED